MDWAKDFYTKQAEWGGWVERWADRPHTDPPAKTRGHVAAVARLAGNEPMRILELGAGSGYTSASLAEAGHSVVAVEFEEASIANLRRFASEVNGGELTAVDGDFYEVDIPGPFDVVCYFDGFGIGTDEDQRRLLRRIAGWLGLDGCALMDILTPWYCAGAAGTTEEWEGVVDRYDFHAEGCRMIDRMWRDGDTASAVTQSIRCYSPADLRLLLEGTGLALHAVEAWESETYERAVPLDAAMLYLATLLRVDPPTRR